MFARFIRCFAILALTASSASAGDLPICGQFGNPPAQFFSTVRPECGAGKTLGPWRDPAGADRYACLYRPGTEGAHNKLPLVVYLHPSLFTAKTIARTSLLDFHYSYALNGDPTRPGFIVLAPQG